MNELPRPIRACRTSSWAGLLPSTESCLMIAYASGSNSSAKAPIEAQVIARHHVRGEPLLEHPAHDPAVELVKFSDRPHRLVFAIDDESGFPVLDDLGDDPQRHAITGVPQAMASISTRPNGSGQSIGNRSATAFPRKVDFSPSPISPMNSISGSFNSGLISSRKYPASTASTFAAILRRMPKRLAMEIARSGRFSGEMRPRKAR